MVGKSKKYKRRSIRLRGYDYSKSGMYFVTICVQNKECLLGHIKNGEMVLNDAGTMVQTVWDEIPQFYNGINIDTFQIMPNHLHGIVDIVGAAPRGRPNMQSFPNHGQPQGVAPTTLSLPDVIHRFKTITTKKYTDGVKQKNWKSFPGRFWQRNYYEHIIRNENDYFATAQYILDNPMQWEMDEYYATSRGDSM